MIRVLQRGEWGWKVLVLANGAQPGADTGDPSTEAGT
jgi:hypothetical protein